MANLIMDLTNLPTERFMEICFEYLLLLVVLVIPILSENNSDCWLLGRSKISAAEEHSAAGRGIARSMVQAKCEAQDKDSLHHRPIYQHKGDDMEAC